MATNVIYNVQLLPSWILCEINFAIENSCWTLFSVSVWNLVWIRSKITELLLFNWFQNGGRRHLGFLHYVNFDGKYVCGTPFSTYVSNLLQMRAIMADLWPKIWFSIWRPPPSWILLDTNSRGSPKVVRRPYSRCPYQIWCQSIQKWRSYCRLTDFKMAVVAILDFCTMWILTVNLSAGHHFQLLFQIWCKYVQWWLNVAKNVIFNMAAAAILDFFRIRILWVKVVGLFSVSVSNLVPICSKMAELLPFNWFQNGGQFMAKNVIFNMAAAAIFDFVAYEIWGKVVRGPYSRCPYQIWCKSVHKWQSNGHLTDFKMAAYFYHLVVFG